MIEALMRRLGYEPGDVLYIAIAPPKAAGGTLTILVDESLKSIRNDVRAQELNAPRYFCLQWGVEEVSEVKANGVTVGPAPKAEADALLGLLATSGSEAQA